MSYQYKLYIEERDNSIRRYTLEELRDMGTFMLRDICVRERIMTHLAGTDARRLDREALIELLYRYRGKEAEVLADGFPEESVLIMKRLIEKASIAAEKIEIPQKLELIRGIPLLAGQEVMIHHGFSGELFLGALTDSSGNIKAVFEVQKNRLVLMPDKMAENMDLGVYRGLLFYMFDASSSLKVRQAYNGQKCDLTSGRGLLLSSAVLPILSITGAADSKEPLIIDFGTSNTSAVTGTGQGQLKYIWFQEDSCLCPSVAAVEKCSQEYVSFRFGYEAWKLVRRDGYGSTMSFFHNLKQYLFEEKCLDICDCDGNTAAVSSDILLKQFFCFVICTARASQGRNYPKIRFLMPEKRKNLALMRLREILPDYQIEAEESESVNSVLSDIIEQVEGTEEHELIQELAFHCGGGTSSLVNCGYLIENTAVAYKILLQERYLNGERSFGGNDLTYLILMYLKIKILWNIRGYSEEILDEGFTDVYTQVDLYGGTKEIYESFRRLYEEAEQVVPTRFRTFDADRKQRQQNFFRLWLLAEKLKLTFFGNGLVSMIQLPARFEELCTVNAVLPDGGNEYRLTFSIHKEELLAVMTPEIYRIVKTFFEPLCNEYGILMGYRIKFTGMSCNIPVFRDALREFTVGCRARTGAGRPDRLKLKALKGAVIQEQMKCIGRVIPEITRKAAAVPYLITAIAHDGRLITIQAGEGKDGEVFGYVSRHNAAREVEFSVCSLSGRISLKRIITLDIQEFSETSYDQLFEAFPLFREIQGDIDSIGTQEVRLFVFKEENWDFCVLPIGRDAGILKTDQVKRFQFDNDSADYFCGLY